MKISVIGIGAMGSVYAGLLHESGHEVWGIDISKEHVQAINESGLRLEGASGNRVVNINATINPADVGVCDLIIIATKSLHVARAAAMAKSLISSNTLVLTIQNGVGSSEIVAKELGIDRLLLGVAGGFGASVKSAGHVHHNGMNLIQIGEMGGSMTPRLRKLIKTWTDAGFQAKACSDIKSMVWEKLICNVCFSGICTVTKLNIGQIMESTNLWPIAVYCAKEAWSVAKAKSITLSFPDPVLHVKNFGNKIPRARPSMLLDHLNGKPSEIDAINGAIVVEGQLVGIPTPYNSVITNLVLHQEKIDGLR